MKELFRCAFMICAFAVLSSAPVVAQVESISVCSPAGSGGSGSCPAGTFDTHQIVFAPDGSGNAINQYSGLGATSDEHSSVFPPGSLQNNDYLFWVASDASGFPLGMVVLSGGSGPDSRGQWTMDFAKADAYGSYTAGSGPVFLPPVGQKCPAVASGNPADQDATFDLSYAAGGSVVVDSTQGPGNLLLIYEGCNSCIGISTATNPSSGAYIADAVATSSDYGHTWPAYRGTPSFAFVPLPSVNHNAGPNAGMGALGAAVCMGNNCAALPPASYGRYAVLTPQTTLTSLMAAGKVLGDNLGNGELSAFVDDVHPGANPYLYIIHGYKPAAYDPPLADGRNTDLMAARAQLNGGTAPLTFFKWNGQAFASPGLGGAETPILPDGAYQNCGAKGQQRTDGTVNYVDDTQQYLLTFVCSSPTDPATGEGSGAPKGEAWFWSTSSGLSDPSRWSAPQEIIGSWSVHDASGGCPDYKGWYPTMMSLGARPGHLSKNGYVFYLWGCESAGTPGGRQFASRAFTMTLGGGTLRHRGVSH